MTIVRLHRAPAWRTVAREQLRSTGQLSLPAGLLVAGIFVALAAAALKLAFVARATRATGERFLLGNFTFSPQVTVILIALGLLMPLIIWQDEDPARRVYHWSMPVAQARHALTKAVAGWAWLMLILVIFLAGWAGTIVIVRRITGDAQRYDAGFRWWEWLVPLSSVSIAYAYATAAAIGTRRPFVWIFGIPILYGGAAILVNLAGFHHVTTEMFAVVNGFYGLEAAVAGRVNVTDGRAINDSLQRWLSASALWGGIGAALLTIVARRRVEPS